MVAHFPESFERMQAEMADRKGPRLVAFVKRQVRSVAALSLEFRASLTHGLTRTDFNWRPGKENLQKSEALIWNCPKRDLATKL
jgi:hypothetical protein